MKKIIATVLAMVMALALCTTAFAADVEYSFTKADGTPDGKAVVTAVEGQYKASKDESYNKVDGYVATWGGNQHWFVKADKSDYTYKLTAEGKADLYVTEVTSLFFKAKAVEFTNIGEKCGQLDGSKSKTYYKATWEDGDDTVTAYYVKADNGDTQLLVDGKLVKVDGTDGLVDHVWKAASYDKDDNVTTYKCKNCDTVATVFKTYDAAKAAGTAEPYKLADGKWLGYTDGVDSTKPADNKGTSPKTFDAGIAMYVGMALTSVAGSAVVIGKKKEF